MLWLAIRLAMVGRLATIGGFWLWAVPGATAQPCVTFPEQRYFDQYDQLGSSVAISGDVAVTGWPGAWILRFNGEEWINEQKLNSPASPQSDGFGFSVAVDGDVVVVGAPSDSKNGPQGGAAYAYRYDGTQWLLETVLRPDDGTEGDRFGESVSITKDRIVIGAPFHDDAEIARGAVYVFRRDQGQWIFEQKLQASGEEGEEEEDQFGKAIDIWENRILVGAPADGPYAGAAYVFQFEGSSWVQQQKLPPTVPGPNYRFGFSVGIESDKAVIGVRGNQSARIFRFDGSQWVEEATLLANDPSIGTLTYFGNSVAISGDRVIVGAPQANVFSTAWGNIWSAGTAYVYRFDGSTWVGNCKLQTTALQNVSFWAEFGKAVAIDGDLALVGAPGEQHFDYGAVYFVPAFADCNSNGVPDACDGHDCNGNRIPDDCETNFLLRPDCNDNLIPDECEPAAHYQLDDGNGEAAWGFYFPGKGDIIWLNQFNVLPGREIIDFINIAWGSSYLPGSPMTLLVYDDPNNDGHPSDAVLLVKQEIRSRDYGSAYGETNIFALEQITPTFVGNAGESFFIGAVATCYGNFPAEADITQPSDGKGWITSNPAFRADIYNLLNNYAFQQVPHDFMVRAISSDCNANGVWDGCDIADGVSFDRDGDSIPDECQACPADIEPQGGDGQIDIDDFLAIINAWGDCPPEGPCLADIAPPIAGDGTVNVDDLLAVINAWGACP